MNPDLKAWALIVAAVLCFVRVVAEVRESNSDLSIAGAWLGLSVFITTFAWDTAELAFADGAFG